MRNHLLPKFGSFHLDQVSRESVVEFHRGMRAAGYAFATCNRMIILLRYMYNLGKKWKIPGAESNPAAGVPLHEANNARERFLTAQETQRLRLALEHSKNFQLQFIVPLLLLTGARKRELLEAKWDHFDLERRTWRIPTSKTGKARHVRLSAAVFWCWPSCHGRRDVFTWCPIRRRVNRMCRCSTAGIPHASKRGCLRSECSTSGTAWPATW